MLFTVRDLIEGQAEPICVSPNDGVPHALSLMAEHDFSQLPVVGSDRKVIGLITARSILRAAHSFNVAPTSLVVSDTLEGAVTVGLDEDIEELLNETKRTNSVVITDAGGKLVGIVTSFDTTEFFRRRAEDMMFVEDIETMLKDHIEALYFVEAGEKGGLKETIDAVTNPARQMRPKFEAALKAYLGKSGAKPSTLDVSSIEAAFKRLELRDRQKPFDELTMADFAELLLLHPLCPKLKRSGEKDSIRRLLSAVCTTRNKLAHFRGDLSPVEREQLRYSKNWLEQVCGSGTPLKRQKPNQSAAPAVAISDPAGTAPIEEESRPTDSVLVPLISYLQTLPITEKDVRIRLQDIEEKITKCKLPKAAHEHRSWWANEPENLRSAQWLEIGWRVRSFVPNGFQGGKDIVFVRIGSRERSYIEFFSGVRRKLAKQKEFPLKAGEPDGRSYFRLADLPKDAKKKIGLFSSFTKSKELRVELYVDFGNRKQNKTIFDKLLRNQTEIDDKLGQLKSDELLRWERMDAQRACRIAVYRAGSIQQSAANLDTLSDWVVESAVRLEKTISPLLKAALS